MSHFASSWSLKDEFQVYSLLLYNKDRQYHGHETQCAVHSNISCKIIKPNQRLLYWLYCTGVEFDKIAFSSFWILVFCFITIDVLQTLLFFRLLDWGLKIEAHMLELSLHSLQQMISGGKHSPTDLQYLRWRGWLLDYGNVFPSNHCSCLFDWSVLRPTLETNQIRRRFQWGHCEIKRL